MVSGTSYQIDVRSDGHPSIDPWIRDIYDGSADRITLPAGMFETSYHGFFDHDSGPGNAARVIYTATKTGRPLHPVFGSLGSTESEAGRLAPDSDRDVCPVLRRLHGGHVHHRGRPWLWAALLCRAEIESTPSWYNANDHWWPPRLLVWPPPLSRAEPGYSMGDQLGLQLQLPRGTPMTASALDGDTCDRDWFKVDVRLSA